MTTKMTKSQLVQLYGYIAETARQKAIVEMQTTKPVKWGWGAKYARLAYLYGTFASIGNEYQSMTADDLLFLERQNGATVHSPTKGTAHLPERHQTCEKVLLSQAIGAMPDGMLLAVFGCASTRQYLDDCHID